MARRKRPASSSAFAMVVAAPGLVFIGLAFVISAAFPRVLWLAYLLVGLAFLYYAGLIVIGATWYALRGIGRALAGKRDRRIRRHVDTALAPFHGPPIRDSTTEVIRLGAEVTQLLARYDRELSDPTGRHLYHGNPR